ncbi:MAG TPA: 2-hydroxyacid dehydrogenase [Aliidongia sp.]|nr:2-hydroxyacid dehydrogenase [Aliidongia sp.]
MSITRISVEVLLIADLLPASVAALAQHVTLLDGRDPAARATLVETRGANIRAIATNGHVGASRGLIEALPKLEIISCFSAGVDYIDIAAAAEHGVIVTNTSAALADDVADVAIAKCLLLLRHFAEADRFVREGQWNKGEFPFGRSTKGKRLGILGLGTIGKAIARRAEVMGMSIAYSSRSPQPDAPYRAAASLEALAAESDFLVVCCPATPETRHLVNARILEALGPEGYLVNIARGSVVDEAALVAALQAGTIAGAGLDVFEHEPGLSPELLTMANVSLSPHIGSATHETRAAMGQLMIDNILGHFAKG